MRWDARGCMGMHGDARGCMGMHGDAWGCMGMQFSRCLFEGLPPIQAELFMSALFVSTRFMSRPIRAQKDLFMSGPIHVQTFSCPMGPIHVRPHSCPPIRVQSYSCLTRFMSKRPIHVRPFSCPTPFMSKSTFSCLTFT